MQSYIVSYDLIKEPNSEGYKKLFDAIKAQGPAIHPLKSVWFVSSAKSSSEIHSSIWATMDSNDKLFVFRVGHGTLTGHAATDLEWLNKNLVGV